MYALNIVQLFDFDNATGRVSNPVSDLNFPTGVSGPYGVCFSPDNTKLYVSYLGNNIILYQYNMLAGNDSAIIASRIAVGSNLPSLGAIQQGPDGRLYFARTGDSLGVITYPDSLGLACHSIYNGIYLGGTNYQSSLGLPDKTIITSVDSGAVYPESTTLCRGQSVVLTARGGTSYNWAPATALSATTGDSVRANPSTSTTYTVSSTTPGGCQFTDSVQILVPAVLIPSFTYHISRDTVTFNSDSSGGHIRSYFWNFGNSDTNTLPNPKYIYHNSDSSYRVCLTIADNFGCAYTYCRTLRIMASGILIIPAQTEWDIYPNPFNDELNINSKTGHTSIQCIEMYDMLGRAIIEPQLNTMNTTIRLNVSNLAKGIYQLKIKATNAEYVMKVVKQ